MKGVTMWIGGRDSGARGWGGPFPKARPSGSLVVLLVFIAICVYSADCQCSSGFPTNLHGSWVTSNRGTWNVTANEIQDFKVTVAISGPETRDFECYDDSFNGYYILKSKTTFWPFSTIETYIYVCLNLNEVSANKYTFNMMSSLFEVTSGVFERVVLFATSFSLTDMSLICTNVSTAIERTHVALRKALKVVVTNVYERVAVYATSITSFTAADICNDVVITEDRMHVALREGSETSGIITCPTTIQSTWSYEYSGMPCGSGSYVDTCTDKTMFNFNETNCNPLFSTAQTLYCVYSGTSGSNTYVTVYNNENETSITAPTSYRFTCLVYSVSDSSISMTTNPEECLTTTLQTPTSISSTYGQIVNFTDIASAPCTPTEEESTNLIWLYVLIALLVLALIIAIIIIIICCIKRRRKRRPVPDEEQQIKEDEKDEARENADGMDGEKKDQVQTKTEEEEDDQRSVDSGFIPDRIDKEEQEKADQEQKNEEEVRAEGDGEKDDKDRPDTVQSRMSDLGRSIAPSDGLSPRDDSPGPAGDHPEGRITSVEAHSLLICKVQDSAKGSYVGGYGGRPPSPRRFFSGYSGFFCNKDPLTPLSEPNLNALKYDEFMVENPFFEEGDLDGEDLDFSDTDEQGEEETETKEEVHVPEQEPQKETNDAEEQHGSDSEGSTADSEDPSEIERRIQMVGMKKQGQQYVPDGELSKVLVTRDMEEKARLKKMKGKRGRGMQKYGKGKSKKQQDNRDKAGTPDSKTEVERLKGHGGVKAEFMEQYHHKKKIEKKLDDEHYWSEEDDKIDNLRIDDLDDEFEASFPEEKIKVENDVVVIEVKDGSDISMTDENEVNKQNEQDKDREKDSGNDSPGVEQTTRDVDNDVNIDSDPDMADVEEFDDGMDEVYVRGTGRLPPGFIRDPQGRIIRIADGQIITEDEMEKLFKKARIKRLFNIARLKRNKKGRPIGGFIDDDYGPEIKQNDRNQAEDNLDNQEGPKRKQSRSSATHRLGGPVDRPRKSQGFIDFPGPRTVGFDVDDVSDIIKIDDDSDELKKKGRRDISTPSRDLLKKRLFKSKKKQRNENGGQFIFVNGADENPRELNSLVKVYGRHGTPYGMQESRPFGGPNLSRTESGRGQMNAEQLQNFRQGLANDRKFLDRKGPGLPVREAFGGGGDLTVEDLSEDDRQLELGSEDEFILVGGNRAKSGNQNEPLFTILRRPDELPGKNGSNGNPGPWCTRHDLRHSIPWSLRVENGHPGISRAHTGLHDESDNSNNAFGLPKSADHKRNLDDRRLREILEELYKDKKYFDHVIDTTGDNDVNLIIDERDLAEHGRDRLLDKADVWEQKQRENPAPLPPWLVPSRMNTAFRLESGRGSQISQTSTATPPIYENYRQKTAPNLTQEVIPEASTTPPMRNSTPDAKNWGRSLSGKEQRDSKPNIDEIIIDADDKGNSKDNDNTNTPLPGQQLEESQSQNENTTHAQFIAPANSAASFSMPPGKNETQC